MNTTTDDLVRRTRAALAHAPNLVEKRMFGSTGFMVQGKLCVSARKDRIMCRIGPAMYAAALAEKGCRAVMMKGRESPGYVYIDAQVLHTPAALQHWVDRALRHNRELAPDDGGATPQT